MSKPFFSVILPTHNGEGRIRKAIDSVLLQTFRDFELIVVCDACDDNTIQEATHPEDPRIRIIETNVHRDGLARNVGLDAASGEWILFMDDDDYFLHEYCFQILSEQVGKHDEDVLNFSFVWKGVGYKDQSAAEQFVMVWCRAWRRSFIGDNRFNSEPYGSDRDFFVQMIKNNPTATIAFWPCPIYYYNYLREGSLSWMVKKKTMLDIIVTHYDEPWEIGRPFFDAMEHQRCVDRSNVNILLVQDGPENALDWDSLFSGYSYHVNVLTVEHGGVSAARNAALDNCSGTWVMFCDFDDFLADACSLSMMLENFPTNDYDLIWMKMVQEQMWYTDREYMNKIMSPVFSNCCGKMYRRSILVDHSIRFDEHEQYYYDHIFNAMVLVYVEPFRIAALTTEFYPYYKTLRRDSCLHKREAFDAIMKTAVNRDMKIAEHLKTRGFEYESARTVAKAVYREYLSIVNPDTGDNSFTDANRFLTFYLMHRDDFLSLKLTDLDPIREEAETETMNFIQDYYNEYKVEYYLVNDVVSFEDWLKKLNECADDLALELQDASPAEPVIIPAEEQTVSEPVQEDTKNQRVIVYCGTYEVYMNMVASLKSVLCNTHVDKVYFLIEDDVFPYELPDIVECINVKNQTAFPEDGPNFNNSWTYMCMMRALYPEMFQQYSKILSLDVDIIFNDDVSDLWDYDITDYYLAGVPERQRQHSSADPLYINFGVVMMNLDKLRTDNKQQEIINILNTQKVDCPEQGAFNKACAWHILELPADYNYTTYSHITGDCMKERIIHYAGQKFWRHYKLVKRYSDLDWNEVMDRQSKLKELHND